MSLPLAAVHRELVSGAGQIESSKGPSAPRVAADATNSAREAVESYLRDAAKEAAKILKLQKKKTVTKDVLINAFVKDCGVVKLVDLSSSKRAGEMRGLPEAGVVRIFKAELAKDASRLSGEASSVLVNAASAYLRAIGQRAGMLVRAGKRNTIKESDVVDARKLL